MWPVCFCLQLDSQWCSGTCGKDHISVSKDNGNLYFYGALEQKQKDFHLTLFGGVPPEKYTSPYNY